MVDKLWMRCTGTQLAESLVHCAPNDHVCNVPAIAIRLHVAGNSDTLQHRPSLPKLDILAVDVDEELPEEWEGRGRCQGRTVGST